jgi:YHS domain-containing protein
VIQFLLWLALATWLVRKVFGWLAAAASVRKNQQQGVSPTDQPKPLHRDPWCGTYVSPEISHTLEQAGEVHHFCSADCRERYRLAHRSQDSIGASA